MNTSATRSLPFGSAQGPRSRRAVQAINNEQLRVRARNMPMYALYKDDTANAALLYKKCSM